MLKELVNVIKPVSSKEAATKRFQNKNSEYIESEELYKKITIYVINRLYKKFPDHVKIPELLDSIAEVYDVNSKFKEVHTKALRNCKCVKDYVPDIIDTNRNDFFTCLYHCGSQYELECITSYYKNFLDEISNRYELN